METPGETLRRDPERASRKCFNRFEHLLPLPRLAIVISLLFEIPEQAEDLRKAYKKDSKKAGSAGITLRSSFDGECRLLVAAAGEVDCFPGACETVSALLRPSSATFKADATSSTGLAGTLYSATIYGLLVLDLDDSGTPTSSRTVTVAGYDLEASSLDPSNPNVLWLGAESPSNAILEYSLVTDRVFRSYEPGGSATLEGLAWVSPDADDEDPVLWASEDLGVYALVRSATYQWSKVNELSSVLMADMFCASCDGLASNIADLKVVDRLLFILVDDHPARVLISINIDTGEKINEHRLPEAHDSWEGIELVPDAPGSDEYRAYLARDHPPQIWMLKYSLLSGFRCSN